MPCGPVHSGTVHSGAARYTVTMQLESVKATGATLWVSAVCAAGIAGSVRSLSGWAVLAGIAIFPPLVTMWRWNNPRQTTSESIREALR